MKAAGGSGCECSPLVDSPVYPRSFSTLGGWYLPPRRPALGRQSLRSAA